jgi:F-type H+-transporting ATPase subunit a
MMTFNYKLTANKIISHIFWMPGVPKMRIVLAPIELLGISLNLSLIRLYANIFAGHIVLMSILV